MKNLCTDILENILFRLPVDAVIQAKRVCTTWRAVIRNETEKTGFLCPHFADNYYPDRITEQQLLYEDKYDDDHSKLMNYFSDNRFIDTMTAHSTSFRESAPKYVIVGSCNGLVCFGRNYMESIDPFLVSNPFTRESACLPEFNSSGLPEYVASIRKPYGRLVSGFGYCPSTNAYKVVSIVYCNEEQAGGHVQVYTLGTGKWRYIGLTGHRCEFHNSLGIYANGALFWLHRRSTRSLQKSEIVAFDLEGEKFHYIALPRSRDFEYIAFSSTPRKLFVGNNNLYLVHTYNGAFRADVWVYKRNTNSRDIRTSYSMKECHREQNYQGRISSNWLVEFSLQLDVPTRFKPLAITRSDALLWYGWIGGSLYLYDPKTLTSNKLPYGREHSIPHTRSIVSLKDLGETNVTFYKDLKEMKLAATELCMGRKRLRRLLTHAYQKRP